MRPSVMTNHAWRDNFVGISQGQTTIYLFMRRSRCAFRIDISWSVLLRQCATSHLVGEGGEAGIGRRGSALARVDSEGVRLGVPQGGVISPLLSNVYLNEVDKMLERAIEATRCGK